MIAFAQLRLKLRAAQDGIAMVMVIGVGAVMTLLVVSALALSLGSQNKADNDQDWNGALAAAFAGLEEYQSHLSEEPGYTVYGNPAATFSSTSAVSLPTGTKTNPAFGVGASGTWATAEDSDGNVVFRYRYEVDNSQYSSTGTLRIRATGLVGGQTRSIVADVRQTGFIDYVYFTDLEMQDPLVSGSSCPQTYTWAGRPGSSGGFSCTITFGSNDVLGGSVHSNDTLQICGATFNNFVTTARPGGGYVKPGGCSTNPTFALGAPIYSQTVPMPLTNQEMMKEVRTDLPDDVPRPGCLYTGPTSIQFIAGGKMIVKSPWTKFTNIKGNPASPTSGDNVNATATKCGTITALQSAAGATIPVPNNNVIYVQNIPTTGINSATTSQTATSGGNPRCKKSDGTTISSTSAGYAQNVVGYPTANEVPIISGTGATASYGCRNGDIFVYGTNSGGPVTLAAMNYAYVVGDLLYANKDTDMIGLVGQNAVWVYSPINSSGNYILSKNREIDAAILSVAHTFQVQRYTDGDRGTLTVYGSIAQKFRGTVGTSGGSGYDKDYQYDPRFRYSAPPKFLSPATTTYGVNVWVEISPVFNVNGTYR
jgi:Tfp pilus assembly protein PilX